MHAGEKKGSATALVSVRKLVGDIKKKKVLRKSIMLLKVQRDLADTR